MRTIDADALKNDLITYFPDKCLEGITAKTLFKQILTDINNVPTVETYTEEHIKQAIKENFDIGYEMAKNKYQRPKGVWLQRWKEYECSQCGYFVIPTENWLPNFCPNCGADMRGDTK